MLDLKKAMIEVTTKTRADIEKESAYVWAARAIACKQIAVRGNPNTVVSILQQAEDYEHEAIEHAALVRDGGLTLLDIEAALAGDWST